MNVNQGFLNIMELDTNPKDIVGRLMTEFFIDATGNESILQELKEKKRISNFEYCFKTLDGKDKCVLSNSYLTKDLYHGCDMVETMIEDISEERHSYDKMRESQERYEKLFMSSGDMVIVFKVDDFIIEEINPITEVITAFPASELTGSSFRDLIHPSKRSKLEEIKKDLLFQGSARLQTTMVCKSGAYKEVIITLTAVSLKGENVALAVIKDIHEQVKQTEELGRRKGDLEDFWKTAVEREERIKELRKELDTAKQKIEFLEQKNGPS